MIQEGARVPDFSLSNEKGETRTLSDYAGKWLVLYVYPKDDTPGCTMQGKAFSAARSDFERAGIQIVGISEDDVESHRNFCKKYGLAVELLADPNTELLTAIDAPAGEWKGLKSWMRTTFVIDPQGVVRKIYTSVNPEGHERVLLDDIAALQSA